MTQPLFPSTIGTESRCPKFLTIKTVVRKQRSHRVPVLREGGAGAMGGGRVPPRGGTGLEV